MASAQGPALAQAAAGQEQHLALELGPLVHEGHGLQFVETYAH